MRDHPDFGEGEEGKKACPDGRRRGARNRSDVDIRGGVGAREDVEQRQEAKGDGPDVHTHVIRYNVVETPQDVGHGEEPEEDGERSCERHHISDRRGLWGDSKRAQLTWARGLTSSPRPPASMGV